MENNEFKKVRIKNRTYYHFDDKFKLVDFDIDNILTDEISYGNILIYVISHKTLIDPKPLQVKFDKIDGFIKIYDGSKCLVLLCPENMMLFTIELDILKV